MTEDLTHASSGFVVSDIHPHIWVCGDDAKYTGPPWKPLPPSEKECLVRAFRQLFPEWSAKRIADVIGITRSSVFSTARQGKIPLNPPCRSQKIIDPEKELSEAAKDLRDKKTICTPHQDPPKEVPPIAEVATPFKTALKEKVVVPVSRRGVTLSELNEAMCRWPLGDPYSSEFRYCGSPAPGAAPYCTHHGKLAYQPAQDRRHERDRRFLITR